MTIAIGSDHAGYDLKGLIISHLEKLGAHIQDLGTCSSESVDYPDFAHPVADCVSNGEAVYGIVICGTGNGVAMSANKHAGIRCGICWTSDIAKLIRQHNNANMLAIPARFISHEEALSIVDAFINAQFEGGRHQRRVLKIELDLKSSTEGDS